MTGRGRRGHRSGSRRRSRDGGYILVAVLAVVVVLTALVAAGTLVVRSAFGTARVAADDVRTAGLLTSGVEVAAYQLAVLGIRPELVDGRPVRLTDGTVTPHVVDEGGRIDLNAADDHGFMYGRSFEDLDGHVFEPMWMDVAAFDAAQAQAGAA